MIKSALVFLFSLALARVQSQTTTIPFKMEQGWIVLELKINGKGPFKFMFDTGAQGERIRLDSAFQRLLGIPVSDSITIPSPVGDRRILVSNIESMAIANLQFQQVQAMTGAYRFGDVIGVIGLYQFRDYLTTIDFEKSQLILSKDSLDRPGRNVLPYTSLRGIPSVKIKIGNDEYDANWDTGNRVTMVSMPKAIADKLAMTGTPREITTATSMGQNFKVYEFSSPDPLVIGSYSFKDIPFTYPSPARSLILGLKFLQQFSSISFDQKNSLLKFECPKCK